MVGGQTHSKWLVKTPTRTAKTKRSAQRRTGLLLPSFCSFPKHEYNRFYFFLSFCFALSLSLTF
jgi:hypothetical protein